MLKERKITASELFEELDADNNGHVTTIELKKKLIENKIDLINIDLLH